MFFDFTSLKIINADGNQITVTVYLRTTA